jgi:hypothetical protein
MKSGRFIELTFRDGGEKKIRIFIDDIVGVADWFSEMGKTHLFLYGPYEISVLEDPETVMKKINEARG